MNCPICGTSYDIYLRVLIAAGGVAGQYHPTCVKCEILDRLPAFRKERCKELRDGLASLAGDNYVQEAVCPLLQEQVLRNTEKLYGALEKQGLVVRVEADS